MAEPELSEDSHGGFASQKAVPAEAASFLSGQMVETDIAQKVFR